MSEEYEEYPDEYLDENGNPCEAEPEQKRGELKPCPFCGGMPKVNDWTLKGITDKRCFCDNEKCPVYLSKTIAIDDWNTRPIEDALTARITELEQELNTTDGLLKEATETIGAVVACCTYNSNDDAKIGIYGIDQKAFTRIDQFMTHYNDAISAGKVSVDVKRELTDAEIEELGAQEAERKEFCPNCEAETPCTHEAELFVCDICGEDFAKYIVSRNRNVSDVSMTRDVLIDIKTPSSIENTNPDYYKQELASRDALIERLIEAGNVLVDQNDMDNGAVMAAEDEWRFLVTEWKAMKGGE